MRRAASIARRRSIGARSRSSSSSLRRTASRRTSDQLMSRIRAIRRFVEASTLKLTTSMKPMILLVLLKDYRLVRPLSPPRGNRRGWLGPADWALRMFISSRAMRAAHGAARPRLVRLQLRGLERVPRASVDGPRAEAESPATTRRGDRPPNRPREPRAAGAVGPRPRRMPHARGEGARALVRADPRWSGPPRRAQRLPAIRHAHGPRGASGRVRPEDPRLEC